MDDDIQLKVGDLIYCELQRSIGVILKIRYNHLRKLICENQWITGWNGDVPTEWCWDSYEFTQKCRRRILELVEKEA
jgi:hypothetical protein